MLYAEVFEIIFAPVFNFKKTSKPDHFQITVRLKYYDNQPESEL